MSDRPLTDLERLRGKKAVNNEDRDFMKVFSTIAYLKQESLLPYNNYYKRAMEYVDFQIYEFFKLTLNDYLDMTIQEHMDILQAAVAQIRRKEQIMKKAQEDIEKQERQRSGGSSRNYFKEM